MLPFASKKGNLPWQEAAASNSRKVIAGSLAVTLSGRHRLPKGTLCLFHAKRTVFLCNTWHLTPPYIRKQLNNPCFICYIKKHK